MHALIRILAIATRVAPVAARARTPPTFVCETPGLRNKVGGTTPTLLQSVRKMVRFGQTVVGDGDV